MASDIAQNGTRAVAVYACEPADLLEVVATAPAGPAPRSCSTAARTSSRSSRTASEERWCVLLANRRNARFFIGDGGGLEETDRVEDDVHSQHDQGGWSQARYQRGVEKEKDDHLVHVAEVAFDAYKRRVASTGCWSALPTSSCNELEHKLHPYLRERIVGALAPRRRELVHRGRRAAWRTPRSRTGAQRCEREALDRLDRGRRPRRPRRGRAGCGAAGAQRAARRDRCWWPRRSAPPAAATRTRACSTPATTAPTASELERCENIVEPAIEKAIEQSAKVIKVRYHDDLGPLGGIGAVLRY